VTVTVTAAGDGEVARRVAAAAGELLLEIHGRLRAGVPPDVVREEGDRRSHELVVSLLLHLFPEDAIVSEESTHRLGHPGARRVWIVDPLDGTREFGEAGRTDWAVHVALVEDGCLTAGAVALPASGLTFCTEAVPAAHTAADRVRVVVSRTRPVPEAQAVADALDGELIPMGSAGAKIVAVVQGSADIYIHSGGQHIWDSAAPVALARAAGLHASRLDGSPLQYDPDVTWLPDLVVCRLALRDQVLAALAAFARPVIVHTDPTDRCSVQRLERLAAVAPRPTESEKET
jgi:3'(2'), 5'-bisphosphate nucleotidase